MTRQCGAVSHPGSAFFPLQDKVAMESMPLLGFTIAPEREEGSSQGGPVFHLYHKKTLFYSFKAEDASSAQRYQWFPRPVSPCLSKTLPDIGAPVTPLSCFSEP